MPDRSLGRFLKMLYEVRPAANGLITTGQLAKMLGVSPSTVTGALKALAEAGLAEHVPYEGARLTDAGKSFARRLLRRRQVIELFLVQTLGLSRDELLGHVDSLDNVVGEPLVNRMDAFLNYPQFDFEDESRA